MINFLSNDQKDDGDSEDDNDDDGDSEDDNDDEDDGDSEDDNDDDGDDDDDDSFSVTQPRRALRMIGLTRFHCSSCPITFLQHL